MVLNFFNEHSFNERNCHHTECDSDVIDFGPIKSMKNVIVLVSPITIFASVTEKAVKLIPTQEPERRFHKETPKRHSNNRVKNKKNAAKSKQ